MARKLRVQYPGAVYHVMNRGDRREPIFDDDQDRVTFLETLGEACAKTDWQVHAWCLMSNHFHLVSEMPRGNLVAGMQWLLGVYTHMSLACCSANSRKEQIVKKLCSDPANWLLVVSRNSRLGATALRDPYADITLWEWN